MQNLLTQEKNRCIIDKHEIKAMKPNVATFLWKHWNGGNFGGVCYGKDQAVRNVLIPESSCKFWVFI